MKVKININGKLYEYSNISLKDLSVLFHKEFTNDCKRIMTENEAITHVAKITGYSKRAIRKHSNI